MSNVNVNESQFAEDDDAHLGKKMRDKDEDYDIVIGGESLEDEGKVALSSSAKFDLNPPAIVAPPEIKIGDVKLNPILPKTAVKKEKVKIQKIVEDKFVLPWQKNPMVICKLINNSEVLFLTHVVEDKDALNNDDLSFTPVFRDARFLPQAGSGAYFEKLKLRLGDNYNNDLILTRIWTKA